MNKPQKPIVIGQPMGGWGLDFSTANTSAIQTPAGQYSRSTAISPFRAGKIGHIAPGEGFTAIADASSRITALPVNARAASDGNFYTILRNGRLVKFSASGTAAHYDPSSATTSDANDLIILKDAAGTPIEYILFTYATASNVYLGYRTLDFSTGNDTFLNLGTTTGAPHVIFTGPTANDIFITNGQYLASVTISNDIAGASTNAQALNLGSGWTLRAGTTYGNLVAMVGARNNFYADSLLESRMWFWNGYSPDPTSLVPFPDSNPTAIFNDNGSLTVLSNGRNGTTKVYAFSRMSNGFEKLFESAQMGSTPKFGAVDLFENKLHWGATTQLNCLEGKSFHQRTTVTDGTNASNSAIGFVKNLSANKLYLGVATGAGNKIFYLDTTKSATTSSFVSSLIELPYKSTVKGFTVYFSQFAAASSVVMSLYKDYNAIGGGGDKLNRTINTTNDPTLLTDMSVHFEKTIENVNSFYLNLAFSQSAVTDTPAIIRAIDIEYESGDKP